MPDWLDPKAPLLSRFLKSAGYTTAHFGKWHLEKPMQSGAYGFDVVADGKPHRDDAHATAQHSKKTPHNRTASTTLCLAHGSASRHSQSTSPIAVQAKALCSKWKDIT